MKEKEYNYFTDKRKPIPMPAKLKKIIRESVNRDIQKIRACREGTR